jgi:acetylglutamate kinase
VRPALLEALWGAGILPLVSPVADSGSGASLNVNADEAALALALALSARSLIYLSDVDGVRVGAEHLPSLDAPQAERLISGGAIAGGMALKVRTALQAAGAGIPEVVIAGRARLLGGFPGTRIAAGAAPEARA